MPVFNIGQLIDPIVTRSNLHLLSQTSVMHMYNIISSRDEANRMTGAWHLGAGQRSGGVG